MQGKRIQNLFCCCIKWEAMKHTLQGWESLQFFRTDLCALKQLFMLIWDTAPLALPSQGTAPFFLCQSQQPFPTHNIYNYFICSFNLIVFSGIYVVAATKLFWLYNPNPGFQRDAGTTHASFSSCWAKGRTHMGTFKT